LTTLAHLSYDGISFICLAQLPLCADSRPNVINHVCLVWNVNMIKVEGLTKRYARTVAVDDISFEVEKGQILWLVGRLG
jgi:ABC-type microcin C transport system duplicated ATPase subunit YejF